MRFRIVSTDSFGADEVLEAYPCLKDYNFEDPLKDNAKATVYRPAWITINSMEELFEFMAKVGESIIISGNSPMNDNPNELEYSIEIYDGYRE